MQKVLVTGGTGYVGSWVCHYLLKEGYTVRLCVRNGTNAKNYAHILRDSKLFPGSLEIVEADLLKPGSFDKPAEECQVIFHIASPFKVTVKDAHRELIDPALLGTQNVLNAATKSSSVRKVDKDFGMGTDHPVAWYRTTGKGRTFYTSMGHDAGAWQQEAYVRMLENAVLDLK